jgi:hypothetical protein
VFDERSRSSPNEAVIRLEAHLFLRVCVFPGRANGRIHESMSAVVNIFNSAVSAVGQLRIDAVIQYSFNWKFMIRWTVHR